jgi:hypothetical protein
MSIGGTESIILVALISRSLCNAGTYLDRAIHVVVVVVMPLSCRAPGTRTLMMENGDAFVHEETKSLTVLT